MELERRPLERFSLSWSAPPERASARAASRVWLDGREEAVVEGATLEGGEVAQRGGGQEEQEELQELGGRESVGVFLAFYIYVIEYIQNHAMLAL